MFIIPTAQASHLGERLKRNRGISVIVPDFNRDGKRYFPDGEVYAKIPQASSLKKARVIVLHTGQPNPNEGLVELELILQILRDSKASPIEVFFSYFPYGMQDGVFEIGETNVAENLIEKLVHYYKVKKIYLVDPHFKGRSWTKKYPLSYLSSLPLLLQAARTDYGNDLLLLSPDKGGKRRTGIAGATKKRKNSYEVEMESPKELQRAMKGRTVAVVDDLLKTGGTLMKTYEECARYGAKQVLALIAHGVLRSGISRTKQKYAKLYLTNTIKRKDANVDISSLIAGAVR